MENKVDEIIQENESLTNIVWYTYVYIYIKINGILKWIYFKEIENRAFDLSWKCSWKCILLKKIMHRLQWFSHQAKCIFLLHFSWWTFKKYASKYCEGNKATTVIETYGSERQLS